MDPALVVAILALALSAGTFVLGLVLVARRPPADPTVQELRDRLARLEALLDKLDPLIRTELSNLRTEQSRQLTEMSAAQAAQLSRLGASQVDQLTQVRESVANRLEALTKDNALQLEKVRATVDEKLQKTLEERLGQSFRLVGERLEQVQKGLGEMQALAVGVGDLKKVLTNVKTRGTMGEYQLGSILEQLLAPEQYEANVRTNPHTLEVVEYAIRLPGRDADGTTVYLPVDSKFPTADYEALLAAYDLGTPEAVDAAGKALEIAFRKAAKDIRDKYLDPPGTTDFGILFVPVEGLYAEVVRRPALLERLQTEFKVVVAGPATFAALLNSLRMGFRSLAIERRSSEVWRLLSAVKTEFVKFGDALSAAQRKIKSADEEIERLVGTRTKMMMKKLKEVETLPGTETLAVLAAGEAEAADADDGAGAAEDEADAT